MANVVYPKAKEAFLSGGINLVTATVKVALIDTADYTYSAGHQYLSDVPAAAREEISAALTGKSVTNGVFDADDTNFPGATGDPSEALIIFVDTGTASTSPLIAYIDTGGGLPVILNTGAVGVSWPNDSTRIFAL